MCGHHVILGHLVQAVWQSSPLLRRVSNPVPQIMVPDWHSQLALCLHVCRKTGRLKVRLTGLGATCMNNLNILNILIYIYIWYIEHLWDLANGPQSMLLELGLLVAKFINPKTQWKHTTKSTNHKYYKFTKPVPSHGKVMAMLAIGHNQDLLWPGPHKIRTGVHRA